MKDKPKRRYVSSKADNHKHHVPLDTPRDKLYTGELSHNDRGSDKQREDIRPFPSDTECICIIDSMPDPFCEVCEGSGKHRSLSLYEKAIKKGLKGY